MHVHMKNSRSNGVCVCMCVCVWSRLGETCQPWTRLMNFTSQLRTSGQLRISAVVPAVDKVAIFALLVALVGLVWLRLVLALWSIVHFCIDVRS